MAEPIKIQVNGTEFVLDVDGATPLLYVLRNDLGLKGARFGCGMGLCGACVVWIEGRPAKSCDVPLWSVDGKSVVTIEGLGGGGLHPVQRALLDRQAGQCGYCLSGIIMTAAAFLRDTRKPSREHIAAALDGHLCRCGTHVRIVDAIERAAVDG
jgi:nicotinate dehydrogenase subunit A